MTLIAAVLVLSKTAWQRACPAARACRANAARRLKSRNPFGRGVVRPSATLPLIVDGLTSPLRAALRKRRTAPRQRNRIHVHDYLTTMMNHGADHGAVRGLHPVWAGVSTLIFSGKRQDASGAASD